MDLEERTNLFNVIGVSWDSVETNFLYARVTNEGYCSDGSNYETLADLARNIAQDIVGTNSNFVIKSELNPEEVKRDNGGAFRYFCMKEGLEGSSKSGKYIIQVRSLTSEEMAHLGRAMSYAITERIGFLDSPDSD